MSALTLHKIVRKWVRGLAVVSVLTAGSSAFGQSWDAVSATVLSQQLYGHARIPESNERMPMASASLSELFATSHRFAGRYVLGLKVDPAGESMPSPLATAAAIRFVEKMSDIYGDHPLLRSRLAH